MIDTTTSEQDALTLLTEQQVATWLNVSVRTVRNWRQAKANLGWIKMGKSIRYRITDVQRFVATKREFKPVDPERHYVVQPSKASCVTCGLGVELVCEHTCTQPAFLICWKCKAVAQVGVGPVPREAI